MQIPAATDPAAPDGFLIEPLAVDRRVVYPVRVSPALEVEADRLAAHAHSPETLP